MSELAITVIVLIAVAAGTIFGYVIALWDE
jgi:hypothetical protein